MDFAKPTYEQCSAMFAKNILTAGQAGLVCGDHVSRDVKISQLVNETENFGSDSGITVL